MISMVLTALGGLKMETPSNNLILQLLETGEEARAKEGNIEGLKKRSLNRSHDVPQFTLRKSI